MSHIAVDIATIEAKLQSRVSEIKSAIGTNIKIATEAESHDVGSLMKAAEEGIIIRDADPKTKELLCEEIGGFTCPGQCPYFYFKKIDKGYAIVDSTFVEPTTVHLMGERQVPPSPAGEEAKGKPEVEYKETEPLPDTLSNELDFFLDALERNMAIMNENAATRATGPAIKWRGIYTFTGREFSSPEWILASHHFPRRTCKWTGISYDCTAYEEHGNVNGEGIIVIKETGMIQPNISRHSDHDWARGFWNNAFEVEIDNDKLPTGFKPMKFLPKTANESRTYTDKTSWNVSAEGNQDGGSVGVGYNHEETVSFDLSDWAVAAGVGKFMWYQNHPWAIIMRGPDTHIEDRYIPKKSSVASFWGGFKSGKPLPNLSFNLWQYEAVYSYHAPKSRSFRTLSTHHAIQLCAIGMGGFGNLGRYHSRRESRTWKNIKINVKTLE